MFKIILFISESHGNYIANMHTNICLFIASHIVILIFTNIIAHHRFSSC